MPRPGWIPPFARAHPAVAALLLVSALAGCGREADPAWSGDAEGDYVYVAAPIAGTLASLQVQAGQQVRRGQPLFALDAESERAAREEAQAKLAAARFQAADTGKGRRAPEVAISQAQLVQARSQLALARRELARKAPLGETGAVSREEADAARAAVDQAQARVAELEASLRVAQLPSRTDERAAAEA